MTLLKGLKNYKAPGADSVVNEFLKYGGYEARNMLQKIINMTSGKKMDQVDSFPYLGSIINKDCGSIEDVNNRITKAQ